MQSIRATPEYVLITYCFSPRFRPFKIPQRSPWCSSFQEFCRAMHLVRCAKRGLPLPEPIPGSARKESKSYNSEEAPGTEQTEQNAHPIAHIDAAQATPTSRITSILGNNQPLQTGLPESGADVEEPGREHRNAEGDYDKHYVCQVRRTGETLFNRWPVVTMVCTVDWESNTRFAESWGYQHINMLIRADSIGKYLARYV